MLPAPWATIHRLTYTPVHTIEVASNTCNGWWFLLPHVLGGWLLDILTVGTWCNCKTRAFSVRQVWYLLSPWCQTALAKILAALLPPVCVLRDLSNIKCALLYLVTSYEILTKAAAKQEQPIIVGEFLTAWTRALVMHTLSHHSSLPCCGLVFR